MSVYIQRVTSAAVIVIGCNMNPLSYWKNLKTSYTTNLFKRSARDDIPATVSGRISKFILVFEQCSILASGLNPTHQCDEESSVQAPLYSETQCSS